MQTLARLKSEMTQQGQTGEYKTAGVSVGSMNNRNKKGTGEITLK